jgi:hypothetical protein
MEFSSDELRLITEALLKAKARSETEGFVNEKRIIDSLPAGSNENVSAAVQLMYDQLLRKIQNAMDHS